MSGRDRNKPCYCGSGQKYKKCHLLIEQHVNTGQVKKLEIYELQKIFDETLHKEICVAKDLDTPRNCTDKIINAHSLTKSLSLERIAEKGHVYGFKNKDLFSFFKSDGFIKLRKLGIRTASTFKGFCSYHDDYLFSSIEKDDFVLSVEQILALFYRSFALEYYKKNNALENARKTFQPLLKNTHKNKLDLRPEIIVANLKRANLDLEDNLKIRKKIVDCFNGDAGNSIKTYAINVIGEFPFVCTGLFALYKDLSNNILQNIYDYHLPEIEYLSLNIFYAKDGSCWIVINWFENDNLINKFIDEFKKFSIVEQVNIVTNMMLQYTENIYFSHDYIEGLDASEKFKIEKLFNKSLRGEFSSLTEMNFKFENLSFKVKEL